MRNFFISLCIAMSLFSGSVLAEPKQKAYVPKAVIAQVEKNTGGRVLNAMVTDSGYQLKVLMPGGRVRIIEMPRERRE